MGYLRNVWAAVTGQPVQPVPLERAYGQLIVRNEQRNGIRTPQVPISLRWMPEDIEQVWQEAELGQFYRLASLCRGMRMNGMIDGLLGQRESIVRLPFTFTGDPFLCNELRGVPATYTQDGVMVDPGVPGSFEAMCPQESLVELIGTGTLAGAAPFELVDAGGPDPVVEPRDLHFLRYNWGTREHIYQGGENTYVVRPGNGRWGMYMPGGRERWWTGGKWLPCAFPHVAALAATFDRLRWQALLADPLKWIKAGKGASEKYLQMLQDFIDNEWARAAGIALPPEYEAGLVESTGRGWEVYREAEERADRLVQVALAGQVVSVSGGTGFVNANVFDTIAESFIQATATGLARTLSEQVIAPWAWRRYGVPPDRAPKVQWDVRSPARRRQDAEMLGAVADAVVKADSMLRPRGLMVDVPTYLARNAIALPTVTIGGGATPALALAAPRDAEVLDPVLEDEPLDDAHASRLADEMTEYGIERCQHGKANRCPICGIERVRGVVPSTKKGQPHGWKLAWKAIKQPKALPASAGTVDEDEIDVELEEGVSDAA